MDNIRFAFICALGGVLFLLWQAWQDDYLRTTSPPVAQEQSQVPPQVKAVPSDDQVAGDIPKISEAPAPSEQVSEPKTELGADAATPAVGASGSSIHVVTDKLAVTIDTLGGDIEEVLLLDVARSAEQPNSSLRLLNNSLPNFFVTQGGLISKQRSAPDHRDEYSSKRDEYRLAKGEDTLEVPLVWQSDDGRIVTKVYTFHRGSYEIGLRYEVTNRSSEPWVISPYLRFWRVPYQHGETAPFSSSFNGVGLYKAEDGGEDYAYQTYGTEAIAENPLRLHQTGGWVAMVQHYFLGAVIPAQGGTVSYFAEPKPVPGAGGAGYATGYIGELTTVEPGASTTLESSLFLGPKLQDELDDVAPGLGLTVDYGIVTIIARPIFWVLEAIHDVVGNWGVAIILLTVIIKLAFYKLSETQYRAMARMRKFAPRMKQLKEQYGDDRQKLQEKMMELYKKEGFNPLGGCWPLLVQMPVFIALYWVLQASVELRHADFVLWINDLSAPDPYYILPVIFGITMYAQQKLSSSSMSMDPMQQRMMQIMPIGLAVFFAFFPAGLVLYWLTNNLLSIAQQWHIYRKIDHEAGGSKAGAN